MKPIETTEKQKEKLLEMCKVLFPEWEIYKITYDNIVCGNQWETDIEDEQESIPINEFSIYWFEFCMTYLVEKLGVYYYTIDTMRSDMFRNSHPIDYLYEEFLKLENK